MLATKQGMSYVEIDRIVAQRVTDAIEAIATHETKIRMTYDSMNQVIRQETTIEKNANNKRKFENQPKDDHIKYPIELVNGRLIGYDTVLIGSTLGLLGHPFNIDLMYVELGSFDVIIGMNWLANQHAVIVCDEKIETTKERSFDSPRACLIFLAQVMKKKTKDKSEKKRLENVPTLCFSLTGKESRWEIVFPTGLKRYKEPLVKPKEIGIVDHLSDARIGLDPQSQSSLIPLSGGSFDVLVGMDRLSKRKFGIVCHGKVVRISLEGDEILQVHGERTQGVMKTLTNTKVDEPKLSDISDTKVSYDLVIFREEHLCCLLRRGAWSSFEVRVGITKEKEVVTYLRFIANFSKIVKPITSLTERDQKYEWDAERKKAF
ncbi:hypothetical protein Tco_0824245 [Tanacetum coccineum]|uniref:Uncharacterized protein n=1 Tax=Tanacetum coccineum TaxID=301880 RepID=A0ABQ5AP90_9ASTR